MSKIGEILINETRKQMEFHKRNASGKASMSLREVAYDGGIRIMGIDYFDEIFNGIPSGGNLSLTGLFNWKGQRTARYSDPSDWGVASQPTLNRILKGNAWVNSQPEKLNIDKKVTLKTKLELDKAVKIQIDKQIRKWI